MLGVSERECMRGELSSKRLSGRSKRRFMNAMKADMQVVSKTEKDSLNSRKWKSAGTPKQEQSKEEK